MNTGGPCRCSTGGQPVDIRRRNFTGSARESDLPIVPLAFQGQHSLGRGKGQYFYHVSEEVKERGLHRTCWTLQKRSGNFRENYTGRPSRSCESRWKKMIGKPYSGKPNVRFDEGELEIEPSATTPALHSTGTCNPLFHLLFPVLVISPFHFMLKISIGNRQNQIDFPDHIYPSLHLHSPKEEREAPPL